MDVYYVFAFIIVTTTKLVNSATFFIVGSPQTVIVGETVPLTLTCTTSDNNLKWYRNLINIARVSCYSNGTCVVSSSINTSYSYECYPANTTYHLRLVTTIIEEDQNVSWGCGPSLGIGTNTTSFKVIVPVTTLTLKPTGTNNVVEVVEGENQTFTCTTGTSRPAAWIEWYIGERNLTSEAMPQQPQQDGDKFVSSSILVYTGIEIDHKKSLYCEAGNIEARKTKSNLTSIFISTHVNNVTITQSGDNNVIDAVAGDNYTFYCTTGPSRPAAWIQWYIGGRNVTNQAVPKKTQQDGDKFISSSILFYTGNDYDHNKSLHCEAVNLNGKPTVKSTTLTIEIKVPVSYVNITPAGINNAVYVEERKTQTFTCTTDTSRPAAWIQWYIGGQNVTNQAIPLQPQQDGDKFISSSTLDYIGNDSDHNTSLYCKAFNFDGEKSVKSLMKTLFIKVPVTTVTLTPTGINNAIDVIEEENQTFTCTTGTSRPAAFIQWYVRGRNMNTQAISLNPQQDGDKLISSSTLHYIGNDSDHNTSLYCQAFNFDGGPSINSSMKTLFIKVLVKKVTLTPNGNNNVIDAVEGENQTFTCTTGTSRPAAWIQWYIGGHNVTNQATPQPPQQDGDKFVSSSILLYNGNDNDHNESLYCGAVNVPLKQTVNSTEKSIYIQVKPKNVQLDPKGRNYTIRETQHIAGINCTATCRPECQYYWSGPNYMQNKSKLILGSVYRNESGTYTCHGINKLGNISSDGVHIEVLYPPFITNLKINSNTTVDEGTMAIFQCDIESNPKSDIEWNFIGTGKLVHNDSAVSTSNFTINRTECSHTGIYMCQATNRINNAQEMYNKTIRFNVLCSVRLDPNQVSTPFMIGVRSEDVLNITTHLIAVPRPVISWTFKSNMTGNISSINSTDIFGDFAHVSNLQKSNMSQADFGVYTLTAYNNAIRIYTRSFIVIPQSPPTSPSNISVSCYTLSLKAIWKSEFNGGDTQTFRVIWWENFPTENKSGSNISDAGQGTYQEDIIKNLQPGTLYFLKVEAKNIHGTTVSNELVNCSTGRTIEESNAYVLGTVIGSASGLVVILLIVGVSFIIRRRIGKGTDENGRTHLTTLKTDEEDEDGMKDNVLYQSAGPNFKQPQGNSGNDYAAVQRKGTQLNDNNVQETALYSEVKGKANRKPQGDVYSKVKNAKKNVNRRNSKSYEDVYENMDIVENGSPEIVPEETKNKDGLQYADLVFSPMPNGSKFVIRGIEDRTIYAIVDTTQNIDPLPDSDDEDIGKITKLEHQENEMD